jgi:hypothetical protein
MERRPIIQTLQPMLRARIPPVSLRFGDIIKQVGAYRVVEPAVGLGMLK